MHTTCQRPIEFPPWKSDIDLIKEFLALERRSATSYTPYIRLQRTKIYSGRSRECLCARECVPVRRVFGFEAHVHVCACVCTYTYAYVWDYVCGARHAKRMIEHH
jgi:hypothetical protein